MNWKPQVKVEGAWSSNALVFATKEEAERYARDLFRRWTLCVDSRDRKRGSCQLSMGRIPRRRFA